MVNEIEHFINYLGIERNCSENTLGSYGNDLTQLLAFLLENNYGNESSYEVNVIADVDDINIISIKKDDITSFIEYLYDNKFMRISIERKIAAIKSFFKFLYNRNYISKNPVKDISFPMKESRLPKFLYLNDINRISDFPSRSFIDYRDKAILSSFYSTGTRVSELAGADLVDLDLEKGRLKVKGKGSYERIVFLTSETSERISEYLNERKIKFGNLQDAIFVNNRGSRITSRGIFNIVDKRVKNAGLIEKVTPHTFRHSFATELLNQGADIRAVQEMLGHKNLSATQVYTHTTKDRLKSVYDRFHPHSGVNGED